MEKFGCSLCTDAPLPSEKNWGRRRITDVSLLDFFLRGGGRLYTDYSAEVQEGKNKRIQSSFKLPVEHFIKFISKRTVYLSFPKTAPVKPNGEVLST